jgi:hypothetical protein
VLVADPSAAKAATFMFHGSQVGSGVSRVGGRSGQCCKLAEEAPGVCSGIGGGDDNEESLW